MKVSDLQQHLADLARLLEASGAKPVAIDLNAIRDGLSPFRDLPLKGFADFLVRAEAYSRGEVLLASGSGGRRSSSPRPAKVKAPSVDSEALSNETHGLYERAADPSVTPEQIEGLVARLGELTRDGLAAVADRIGLKGMKSKSKGAIQQAIRERIIARKGASQRAGLIDRPATFPNSAPSPASGYPTLR